VSPRSRERAGGPRPLFFQSGDAFRAWLTAHHDRETELLVGLYKKGAKKRGMTYQQALDEALAYGWIDGVRRSLDADRWTIRFTPRTARSIWSNVNIRHATRLIADGRMAAPGLRAFEQRDPKRSGVYSYESTTPTPDTLDRAAAKVLAASKGAKTFFDAQPPGYKRLATRWIMSAKKPETRQKRLARLIELSSRRKRIDFLKPNA
jgi:uncharacterized protein YdeI (YjbR/CyaY-like superfamily)